MSKVILADADRVRQRERARAMLLGALVGGLVGVPLIFMFTPISILFGLGAGALLATLHRDYRVA